MKIFLSGFVLGVILRNKVTKLGIKVLTSGISTFYKLKKQKQIPKTICNWYYSSGVKNKLNTILLPDTITFIDLVKLYSLPIGDDSAFYIEYYIDTIKYINVYKIGDIINKSDFEIALRNKNIICCSIMVGNKNEYITKKFKMFLNKEFPLKYFYLFYNFDKNNEITVVFSNGINKLYTYKICFIFYTLI